jgi:hypothetical protein
MLLIRCSPALNILLEMNYNFKPEVLQQRKVSQFKDTEDSIGEGDGQKLLRLVDCRCRNVAGMVQVLAEIYT